MTPQSRFFSSIFHGMADGGRAREQGRSNLRSKGNGHAYNAASTRLNMMLRHFRQLSQQCRLVVWVTLVLLFWSPMAFAQSGYYVVPWLTVEGVYDDNLFFDTEDEVSDFVTRVSPQLDIGFESETLRWLLSYRNDAEWYNDLSDLDSNSARRFGVGTIDYQPNRLWTFTGSAEYVFTNSAQDISLIPGGGIPGIVGREEAERLLFSGGARYQFSPSLTGGLEVTWIEDSLVDLNENETLSLIADLEQVLSSTRSILYGYEYRSYEFTSESGTDPVIIVNNSEDSNTAWVGLEQVLSETSTLELRAGPRILDGDLEPYFLFSWRREYARGSTVVDALWDESTLLGELGVLESRSVLATWTHEFSPDFEVRGSAGYAYLTGGGFSTDIASFDVEASYEIIPSISLTARYGFNDQTQDSVGTLSERITHNVVSLAITFTRPRRESERSPG